MRWKFCKRGKKIFEILFQFILPNIKNKRRYTKEEVFIEGDQILFFPPTENTIIYIQKKISSLISYELKYKKLHKLIRNFELYNLPRFSLFSHAVSSTFITAREIFS